MDPLPRAEVLIAMLFAMVTLTAIARRLVVPVPIVLVLGGLALGLLPGVPDLRLEPDLVFLVFLPPILWSAAYGTSLREFKENLRPILQLAFGLVIATTVAIGAVAHALLPGIGWPAALALGAIVSPPDAAAATAMARRLGLPRRIVAILEGESLVNDASALMLYRTAVAAAVAGGFSLGAAAGQFVLATVGGVVMAAVLVPLVKLGLPDLDRWHHIGSIPTGPLVPLVVMGLVAALGALLFAAAAEVVDPGSARGLLRQGRSVLRGRGGEEEPPAAGVESAEGAEADENRHPVPVGRS